LEANALRCGGKCLWLWGQMPLSAWVTEMSLVLVFGFWFWLWSATYDIHAGTVRAEKRKTPLDFFFRFY